MENQSDSESDDLLNFVAEFGSTDDNDINNEDINEQKADKVDKIKNDNIEDNKAPKM